MLHKEIGCQSLLRRFTAPDGYFHGSYAVDVYQNCVFACRYCDSSYDSVVYVCSNALELLEKEVKEISPGRVVIGSVHDPYQPVEKSYRLVRKIISFLITEGFSVHVLTKSPLVLRDLDVLTQSQDSLVTVSMISLDPQVNQMFEPLAPFIQTRLRTVKTTIKKGVFCGVAIFPILPFLVDSELETIIKRCKYVGARYIIYKYLELKGRQKQDFFTLLSKKYPILVTRYKELYGDQFSPNAEYINNLDIKMRQLCVSMDISCGIPENR